MSDNHLRDDAYRALKEHLAIDGVDPATVDLTGIVDGLAAASDDVEIGPAGRLIADDLSPGTLAALAEARLQVAKDYDAELTEGDPFRRLADLRREMAKLGLDGFVVPLSDEHQGEWIPRRARRLAWLTGFTGSAGLAIVTADRAAIFVDGRYTLQVRVQVSAAAFEPRHVTEQPPVDWLAEHLPKGGKLGFDPWLHTRRGIESLAKGAERAGGELVAVAENPLDNAWSHQPPSPLAPVVPHDEKWAGEAAVDKRDRLAADLRRAGAKAAVLTQPDGIAWLLNIRGGDVPSTPLPLSFALLHDDARVDLFIDPRKVLPETATHLGNGVAISPPDTLAGAIDALGAAGARVQLDPGSAGEWLFRRLEAAGARVATADDPCILPRACKNQVELDGARAAHVRDGAAVTKFLAWLAEAAPNGGVDELKAAAKLRTCRAADPAFRYPSFETISGAGPNSALPHYRVTPDSNRALESGEIYLVDSGGQYPDGTTDITRTVAIGPATEEMRDRFTRVLKGHIAIARCRFPEGTTGGQIDALARQALWQVGLDFDHGTGHGVGSFLSVHEGPQRISKAAGGQALKPGMILSNEPGYYQEGAFGIRIENLLAVVAALNPGGSKPMLRFETLTLAPIDLNLVDPGLLDATEIAWLNDYHDRVRSQITPLVDRQVAAWLDDATRAIGV